MAKGGRRKGAGRPAGAVSRVTAAQKEAAAQGGESPLEYMLRIMREASDEKRRDAMATAAAPYCHNRLASIEHGGKDGGPIKVRIEGSDDTLNARLAELAERNGLKIEGLG